ncbi:MAG: TonB-dependent receptor [Bacteroidota bacterium]
MKNLYPLALLGLLFVLPGSALAQGIILRGQVVEADSKQPVVGATVKFMDFRDTTNVTYAITDRTGFFQVEDMRGRGFRMVITSVGFEPIRQTVRGGFDQDLGILEMSQSTTSLQNVDVTGTAVRTEQRGDTTVYNADAYQTMPDATAEELIQKMPGIVVENGSVQAQGEDVQQVLVDGRRFFSTDPTLALRSMPAEVIQRIEVFDQQSEQSQFTGFDDGDEQKTLNLVTRENMRQGQFGKLYGGYGYENKYKAGGSVNFFNNERRLAVIGQSNNINQQNFSSEDILGVTGSTGGGRGGFGGGRGGGGFGGRAGGGGGANNFLVGQTGGVSTTHAVGINYTDNWGDKTEVEGTYFFNNRDNFTDQLLTQTYLAGVGEGQIYDEQSVSNSLNFNHRLTGRLVYTASRNNSFVWRPTLRLQSNELDELLTGNTALLNEALNGTTSEAYQDRTGFNFNQNLLWRHRFQKFGRTLSVNLTGGANTNTGGSSLLATNSFLQQGLWLTDSLDQLGDQNSMGYNVGTTVSFTETLGRRNQLSLESRTTYRSDNADRSTELYNEVTGEYDLLDTALSSLSTNGYLTQRIGGGLMRRNQGGMLMLRLFYQYANLQSDQTLPQALDVNYNFHNILPMAVWRYTLDNDQSIQLVYRASTQEPEATELSPVVDNSNPLQWSAGNPLLQQQYQHNVFTRFSASNSDKGRTFFVLLGGGVTENYITQTTFLAREDTVLNTINLPAGQQISVPVNLDGFWNLRSFVTYGLPLEKLKSNLNFNAGLTYSNVPGQINGVDNVTSNAVATAGLVLSSNISERVDFTLSSRTNYTLTNNALQPELNTTLVNQLSTARFNWAITDEIIYRTQFSHNYYDGLSDDLEQQQIALWNMSLGYRFLKDNRGELSLEVFDLLNQNASLQRNVTDIYIEDVQTNALQRFFMLTFTYNLRAFGTPPASSEDGFRRGGPGGGFPEGRPGGGRGSFGG